MKNLKSIDYNKLIRDRIPEIIKNSGKESITRVADGEELLDFLNNKLYEELDEYKDSGDIEELADLYEVVLAILDYKGVSLQEFENIRIEKREKRGAFKKGLVLEKVIDEKN